MMTAATLTPTLDSILASNTARYNEDGVRLADVVEATHERNLRALTERVTAIKTAKVDAVADTRALKAVAIPTGDNHPAQVMIHAPGGIVMAIGGVAHDQFAQRLQIDKRYYDRMKSEAAPLLAQNLNWWLQNTPEERLLRMLKPAAYDEAEQAEMAATGAVLKLRGVLGKGYRTIDDADLIAALLPTLMERGALLEDFSIDDRRMHAKFFTPAIDAQAIKAAYATKYGVAIDRVGKHGAGHEVWVNEVLQAGVVIRHSEVGFASLAASFVTRILKCLNDYVGEASVAIRHVGGKNGTAEQDVRYISDATQLMDNAALLGRVTDTVAHQLTDKNVAERAAAIIGAKTDVVARPEGVPLFEFVGNLGGNLGFTQTETEVLKQETFKAVGEEGGEVRFAFVQGITAVAREMTDYDRRLEFERQGFALLHDDAGALLKLGQEATTKRRAA